MLVLVAVSLLWLLFSPSMGVVALLKQRRVLHALELENQELKKANAAMRQDIDRIKNDPAYLEELARSKDYGLLKENETVFEFPETKTEQK